MKYKKMTIYILLFFCDILTCGFNALQQPMTIQDKLDYYFSRMKISSN
jgi:hypothetical protein